MGSGFVMLNFETSGFRLKDRRNDDMVYIASEQRRLSSSINLSSFDKPDLYLQHFLS